MAMCRVNTLRIKIQMHKQLTGGGTESVVRDTVTPCEEFHIPGTQDAVPVYLMGMRRFTPMANKHFPNRLMFLVATDSNAHSSFQSSQ